MGRKFGLAALAVLALAACGQESEPPPPAPGEPARVVFKHQRMFGDPGPFDEVLRDFERSHPGVEVVSEPLPGDSDLMHQLYVTNLEGGSRDFDVLSVDVIWVPEFARAGWLLDLSDRLSPERVRAEFFAGPAEAVTWGGRTWAVPWFVDAGLLYWRKDLLAKHGLEPPRTWLELERAARKVLGGERRPRLKGFVWQGRQYEGLVCAALEAIRGFGGGVLDDSGRVALTRPEAVRALAFLRRLVADGVSPPLTTSADEEVVRNIFEAGDAVFMRNWPYALALLEREGSAVRGKVGFGPPPAEPGGEGGGTLGGWQLALNARMPAWKREGAWALVRHFTSPLVERRLLRAYGLSPPRPAVYRTPALLAEAPLAAALEPVFARARPRPVTPYYLMISQVLQSELSAAVSGLRSPEEAAERAARQLRHILGEGQ